MTPASTPHQSPTEDASRKKNAALVYHFFAHYRAPILTELLSSSKFNWLFVGASEDPRNIGVRSWKGIPRRHFLETRCKFVYKHLMVQSHLVRLALRRDLDAIVYLGDAQYLSTWVSATLARLTGKRVLFWTIGWTKEERGKKELVRRAFYRLAHGLLLYGERARTIALKAGFQPRNIYVVFNSLDYKAQAQVRESVSLSELESLRNHLVADATQPIVICVTRIERKRRLDLLLDAQAILKAEGHPVTAVIVGEGHEQGALEERAKELGVEVVFYGPSYDEETIGRLFMAANLTVAPGMVGLLAMHSLAYGTPVVTHGDAGSQAPESEAIEPGVSGAFFNVGNAADLARVIREWTSKPWPNETVREACINRISRFYNPQYQRHVIDMALEGEPADRGSWEASR